MRSQERRHKRQSPQNGQCGSRVVYHQQLNRRHGDYCQQKDKGLFDFHLSHRRKRSGRNQSKRSVRKWCVITMKPRKQPEKSIQNARSGRTTSVATNTMMVRLARAELGFMVSTSCLGNRSSRSGRGTAAAKTRVAGTRSCRTTLRRSSGRLCRSSPCIRAWLAQTNREFLYCGLRVI